MAQYDYKVVPAPGHGIKAKGVKAPEDRFALALAQLMNTLAEDGWEYQRAETLPCEESKGLLGTSTTTVYRSVLVFRRERRSARTVAPAAADRAEPAAAPVAAAEAPPPAPQRFPAERAGVLRAERAEAAAQPRAALGIAQPSGQTAIFRRPARAEPTLSLPPRPLDQGR